MEFSDPFVCIMGVFSSIAESALYKTIISGLFVSFSFLFGVQYLTLFEGLLILVFVDFLTAICAAMSTGEKITSRKSLRTSYKIFVYSVAILTSHLVDKCFGFPILEYWVIAYLTCSEAISNFENLFKIGFNTPSPTALKKKLEQFYQPKRQPKKP